MDTKATRFILIWILAIILMTNVSYGLEAQPSDCNDVKVIMIIVNRIDLNDLENMPYVMMDKSSIALMNTRASGNNSEFKSYAP